MLEGKKDFLSLAAAKKRLAFGQSRSQENIKTKEKTQTQDRRPLNFKFF
jgi:hypothetical protein